MLGTFYPKPFKQKTVEFKTKKDGLSSDKVNCICPNPLIIGTDNGLNIVGESGNVTYYDCGNISCIYKHKNPLIYFASGNKIFLLNNSQIKLIGECDGDIKDIDGDERIFAVTEDKIFEIKERLINDH